MSGSAVAPSRTRLAVSVAFAGQGFCFAALVTRIPTLQDRFALSDGALAVLLVIVPVVAGVGSVTAGLAAARFGSRPVLRVYGPVVPLSVVAVGASESLPLLVASLVVVGLGLGSVDATMNMQGVAIQTVYGRSIMASFFAVFSLAAIAGAGASSLSAYLDWSLVLFFGLVAIIVVPCQLYAGQFLTGRSAADIEPDVLDSRVPWGPILVLGLAIMCVYVIDASVSNYSAVFLTKGLSSTESVAALAYGAYALTTLLGRGVADRAVRRSGAVRLVRVGAVVGAVGLAVAALAPDPAVAILGFAVVGFGLCAALPFAFVAADSHDPSGSGVAVARVNVANYLGFVVGAALVGGVAEGSSYRLAFLLLIPVAIAVAALAPRFEPAPREVVDRS